MKRFNLSKELFFGSVLIGVLSLGLASCGGGGGGGGGGVSTSQPSFPLSAYIYQGTDYPNEPIITVYIDGQPVKLLADTGDSGLVVNQSAVNIPSSDYTNYTFLKFYGDGSDVSGTIASATVCLNPSITNTCVVMPIGVNTSGNAFSGSSEAQGDFGLDSSTISVDSGSTLSGSVFSSFTGYSYPTYLAQEYGINSYTIEFYPLSNTYYEYASPTTPIGEISFGTNASSTYLPYVIAGTTVTIAVFPASDSLLAAFDTGSNFNFLPTNVFLTEIPNFSTSSDENANNCFSNTVSIAGYILSAGANGVVNGGYSITYQIPYNLYNFASNLPTAYYSTTFTTEPPSGFCSSSAQWNVMTGNTIDIGRSNPGEAAAIFGLSEMLRHTFVWVLNNQGFVQGISISP